MKTFLTEYGKWGGQLEAEDWEEAELLAKALGVEVVGELIEEIEWDMSSSGSTEYQ